MNVRELMNADVVTGIITRADLVRAFMRPDTEIENEIRERILARPLWLEPAAVDVSVRAGEVVLTGELASTADVQLLERLVEQIPGVVAVRARLTSRTASVGPRSRIAR